jgi:hypothetical protein
MCVCVCVCVCIIIRQMNGSFRNFNFLRRWLNVNIIIIIIKMTHEKQKYPPAMKWTRFLYQMAISISFFRSSQFHSQKEFHNKCSDAFYGCFLFPFVMFLILNIERNVFIWNNRKKSSHWFENNTKKSLIHCCADCYRKSSSRSSARTDEGEWK